MSTAPSDSAPASARKWQPLNARQRRIFGVLVEKAKTTPDAYPMTINGLVAGANQKSNREPLMNLTADDVEQVLDELRGLGAVTEVQGSGRVAKYRHHAYEWLGVEKTELAVMTELLLRGEQTLGELRGRAARMEPIADMAALKPVVDALLAKGLMIELTSAGRGQIVSHNVYKERELAELRQHFAGYVPPASSDSDEPPTSRGREAFSAGASSTGTGVDRKNLPTRSSPSPPSGPTADQFSELSLEVAELRAEVARLRETVGNLEAKLQAVMG
jgi:uncharacterized protein YceH (UPF0502 family)